MLLFLPAGRDKMKSKMPKVLHEVMGRPMVKRVVDTAKDLGAKIYVLLLVICQRLFRRLLKTKA